MRVLFLSSQPFFAWRGSPIRVSFDVRAIGSLGHEVDLLTLPDGDDVDIPGVNIVRLVKLGLPRDIPIGPSFGKFIYDLLMIFKGWSMIRRNHYDVIHGVEDAGAVGAILARLAKVDLIFEKHSDPTSYQGGALLKMVMSVYKAVEHWTIHRASAVIATGPALVDQVRTVNPEVRTYCIHDIPSSSQEPDEAIAAVVRKELQQTPEDTLAVYAGSFASYQGIDLLFESMPIAIAKCPTLRFIIIGGSEVQYVIRRAWLGERGIADRVSMIGKVPPDELPHYLRACDIVLSPRIAGTNTPLKLLDYLKSSRAIVATDLPANRLILNDEMALMAQANADAFGCAIAQLAGDSSQRAKLAGAGRALIDSDYNYAGFREQLRRCYEEVLIDDNR
jgi:glycosyltransferase involved in cell wall biosynthesis